MPTRPRLVGCAMLACLAGCVERRVTITTQPEGANVILNDQDLGRSPVTVPFTWYGDYDVVCRKEGHGTVASHFNMKPPWYQLPGPDLIAECLVPVTIRDHRAYHFDLPPAQLPARDELLGRAGEFKDRALHTAE